MLTGKHFRLERATLAVGRVDGKRQAITVPVGTVLRVIAGPTNGDGIVTVLWDGPFLEMFAVDVDVRGTEIAEQSAGA
jgi:hypothetical protein